MAKLTEYLLESTLAKDATTLKKVLTQKLNLKFEEPVAAKLSNVKYSLMFARLPADALAIDYEEMTVVISGNHCYVIDGDDNMKGPFANDDYEKIINAFRLLNR
jgi:hypothetical protein